MTVTVIVGFALGQRDTYPGSAWNFIANVLLLKSSYVGAFWFVQTYVLLVLTSPLIFKLVEKCNTFILCAVSFVLYCAEFILGRIGLHGSEFPVLPLILNAAMLYLRSQFSFIIGAVFAKTDFIDSNSLIQKILSSKFAVWALILGITAARGMILTSMVFAPFSAIALVILLGNYKFSKPAEKALTFFGNHSTNMWLTHMQFYMCFASSVVFASRNVFITFATLIALSLACSFAVNFVLGAAQRASKKLTRRARIQTKNAE